MKKYNIWNLKLVDKVNIILNREGDRISELENRLIKKFINWNIEGEKYGKKKLEGKRYKGYSEDLLYL